MTHDEIGYETENVGDITVDDVELIAKVDDLDQDFDDEYDAKHRHCRMKCFVATLLEKERKLQSVGQLSKGLNRATKDLLILRNGKRKVIPMFAFTL